MPSSGALRSAHPPRVRLLRHSQVHLERSPCYVVSQSVRSGGVWADTWRALLLSTHLLPTTSGNADALKYVDAHAAVLSLSEWRLITCRACTGRRGQCSSRRRSRHSSCSPWLTQERARLSFFSAILTSLRVRHRTRYVRSATRGTEKKTGKEAGGQEPRPFLSRQAREGVTHKKTRARSCSGSRSREQLQLDSIGTSQPVLYMTHTCVLLLCSCLPQRPCRIGIRTTLDLQVRYQYVLTVAQPASGRRRAPESTDAAPTWVMWGRLAACGWCSRSACSAPLESKGDTVTQVSVCARVCVLNLAATMQALAKMLRPDGWSWRPDLSAPMQSAYALARGKEPAFTNYAQVKCVGNSSLRALSSNPLHHLLQLRFCVYRCQPAA